ncbi:MFS general substrate transporter [Laetiporus sulphureus 93-53]|uniref:MFS general substrate transporter n=1 Tax=Laetiporus sulphureus 93-53 TaxID=1314785 RepID=A0A165BN12_9APHY|nr:MFS general substrate transporter [Laetiporus sulphureus 93-53]KZT01338.1 MFS general substrate transporter [Laetiporus sulphureus 93-53]
MKHTSEDEVVIQNPAPSTDDLYVCGPWRAWSTVFGAWLLQFSVVGYMSAFGVMQSYYSKDILANESASSISWIGSIQLFLDLCLAAGAGHLLDRGYFRHCVVSGSLIFVFCLFMLSLAQRDHYYQFLLAQGFGMGTGVGLIYLPTCAIVSQHFKQRKAFAMGLVGSGGSLGAVVFSISLNYLLNGSLTFGWAIRVTAFIVTGLLLLGNLLMFKPTTLAKHDVQNAESEQPRGDSADITDEKKESPANTPPTLQKESSKDEGSSSATPARVPFWDTKYILFLIDGFLYGLGMWFPSYYVQLYAEQHGISEKLSFYALAIMNFANMVGRILPNWLGDRFGVLDIYIPCVLASGGIVFATFGCSTPYGLVLFTIFYGFFFGTGVSLYLPVVSSISKDGVDIGKRMGISLFPVGIASLIGNPINGAILGQDYIWWKGVTFAGVTMLAGGAILVLIRLIKLREKASR